MDLHGRETPLCSVIDRRFLTRGDGPQDAAIPPAHAQRGSRRKMRVKEDHDQPIVGGAFPSLAILCSVLNLVMYPLLCSSTTALHSDDGTPFRSNQPKGLIDASRPNATPP
jgi:hypothetical protein